MEQNQKRIKTIVKESLKVLTKPWAIFIEELNHRWQTSSNRLLLVLGVCNKAPMAKEKPENKEQKKEQVVKNSPSRSPAASFET
ncbi:hypothetical protein Gasu2_35800 [Galdieria sulphuraria]|nr:hypothetical protein Gasu2_35800 [Galdieria sulphuraria]